MDVSVSSEARRLENYSVSTRELTEGGLHANSMIFTHAAHLVCTKHQRHEHPAMEVDNQKRKCNAMVNTKFKYFSVPES